MDYMGDSGMSRGEGKVDSLVIAIAHFLFAIVRCLWPTQSEPNTTEPLEPQLAEAIP